MSGQRTPRWGDLRIRVASAVVLAPVALVCIWQGGVAFALLVAAAALGLAFEWLALCRQPVARRGGVALRAAGLLFVALAAVSLLFLRADPVVGRADVVFVVVVVWAADIGAYLVGRMLGGPRLAPRISPGKTWSGGLGGLAAAVAAGLVVAAFLAEPLGSAGTGWRTAVVAAAIAVVGQAGDLLESFVKRRLEVKDSGHLIPGHGGLFDRLDAILAAAVAAAALALVLGRGVVLWQ